MAARAILKTKKIDYTDNNMITLQKTQTFFKEVYVELRKVNWLTRREIIRYTLIVLAVTLIVAAVLGGLDYIFSTALKTFIVN